MFPSYDDPYISSSGSGSPAHSAWVKTLAENGIPGALLLIGYVGSFAVVGLSRKNPRLRLLGLFAALVMSVAFLSTEYRGKGIWLLAAGATYLLHKDRFRLAIRRASGQIQARRRLRRRSVSRS